MPKSPNATPVPPGLIEQATGGIRSMVGRWMDSWFGPGQPIAPVVPPTQSADVRGRQFDFRVNVNTQYTTRDSTDGISFAQMRSLADNYDLMRLVIERRKDQLAKMRPTFGLTDAAQKMAKQKAAVAQAKKDLADHEAKQKDLADNPPVPDPETGVIPPKPEAAPQVPEIEQEDPRIVQLREFFAYPDQEHDWETWLRALMEDLLVCDAPCLYPRETLDGSMYALELVDGTTVKRVIDGTGRTPVPPDVAYQQILHGLPAVEYNRDELIYRPRNVRTHKAYGYSPVEQVIMTVNIALRRQVHQLQFYTEGNVPEMIFGVPETWNPDQIKAFQDWWDSLLEGNTAERRHAKFVPGGTKPFLTKDGALKDEYDEWLARIVCFAFQIDPTPFVKAVNRATAESAKSQALSEGLAPLMNWVKNLVDYVIHKYFGWTDLEFKWEEEDDTSPQIQAEIICAYSAAGLVTDDEAREKIGMPPLTAQQKAELKPPAPPPLLPGIPGAPKPGAAGGAAPGKALPPAVSKRARPAALDRNRAAQARQQDAVRKAFASAFAAITSSAASALRARAGSNAHKAASGKSRARALDIMAHVDLTPIADQQDDVADALAASRADGFASAGAQVSAGFDEGALSQANDRAVVWAEDEAASLVTDLTDSTRQMLATTIAAAMDDGATNDEIADVIGDAFGLSEDRADTIARTETAYADVAGNVDAYKESGVVDGIEWVASAGDCDICDALDGTVTPLGDAFEGGITGPPAHPNCRCDVLPVLSDN
jgi:SPP1 gp7 family putative phage head morphogenesis protein